MTKAEFNKGLEAKVSYILFATLMTGFIVGLACGAALAFLSMLLAWKFLP